jgi:Spy/CpxP family protein refolding chaperone
MIRSKPAQFLYLLFVFASGLAVGALGHKYYSVKIESPAPPPPRNPEEYRRKYMEEMTTRLNLTAKQQQELNAILDYIGNRFRELRERSRPEERAIRQEQVDKVNAILTPEQRVEYAKMLQEREERRKRMMEKGERSGGR